MIQASRSISPERKPCEKDHTPLRAGPSELREALEQHRLDASRPATTSSQTSQHRESICEVTNGDRPFLLPTPSWKTRIDGRGALARDGQTVPIPRCPAQAPGMASFILLFQQVAQTETARDACSINRGWNHDRLRAPRCRQRSPRWYHSRHQPRWSTAWPR